LQELISRDAEKHAEMDQFIKKQQLIDTEREHKWKEWQSRFELIESQTDELMNYLQILDSTNRSIQSTQKSVEELSEQVERRINEITEMQRLAEDRFRQEWVTFRSDDQKRWTNYTLTMEEQRGELQRQQDKMRDRMTNLEDETQEIEDLIEQMNEQTNKRLQSLLSAVHEWVTNFERSIGSSI
jgi:chromosome segregation ATPase